MELAALQRQQHAAGSPADAAGKGYPFMAAGWVQCQHCNLLSSDLQCADLFTS